MMTPWCKQWFHFVLTIVMVGNVVAGRRKWYSFHRIQVEVISIIDRKYILMQGDGNYFHSTAGGLVTELRLVTQTRTSILEKGISLINERTANNNDKSWASAITDRLWPKTKNDKKLVMYLGDNILIAFGQKALTLVIRQSLQRWLLAMTHALVTWKAIFTSLGWLQTFVIWRCH